MRLADLVRRFFWTTVILLSVSWMTFIWYITTDGDEHKPARQFTEAAATTQANSQGTALQQGASPPLSQSPESPSLPLDISPFGTIAQFEASAFSRRYQTKYGGVNHAKTGVRFSPISYQVNLSGPSGAGLTIRDIDGAIIGFGVSFSNDRGLAASLPWTADIERFSLEGLSTFLTKHEAQAVLEYMKVHRLDVHSEGVGNGRLTQMGKLWVAAGTTGGDLAVWVALEDNRSPTLSPSVEEHVTQLKVRGKTVMLGDPAESVFATLEPTEVVSQSTKQDPAIPRSLLVAKHYMLDGKLWILTFRRREAHGNYVLAQIQPG